MIKIKVVHVISSMDRGGKERQLFELLKGIKDHISVSLIVLDEDLEYPVSELNIPIFLFKKEHRKDIYTYRAISKIIRSINPDIIQYWDVLSASHAIIAKMITRCKVIDGTIRYAGEIKVKLLFRFFRRIRFLGADKIIANSMAGLRVEGLIKKDKAIVVPNGIDLARFDSSTDSNIEFSVLAKDIIKIVMVAAFRPAKDYGTLIEAAGELCKQNDKLKFLLVGEGDEKTKLENDLPSYLKNHVFFIGRIEKVEQLLKKCDIGILLNNTNGHAEGLSNSIMEYMAAGLPVVATNSGGTPELITNGKNGFLVDAFNRDQIIDRLSSLIESPDLREKLGCAGRQKIELDFTLKQMVDNYMDVYRELV